MTNTDIPALSARRGRGEGERPNTYAMVRRATVPLGEWDRLDERYRPLWTAVRRQGIRGGTGDDDTRTITRRRTEVAPMGGRHTQTMRTGDDVEAVLLDTLAYARERNYIGYDKADGASSRLLNLLPIESERLGMLFQETVKRSPVNVRPLLRVSKRRSYKGNALFALAYSNLWARGPHRRWARETDALLQWSVENRSRGYAGLCGGHQHDVHMPSMSIPAGTPDIVSTSYTVKALLRGRELDPSYAALAETAADFVFEDLNYTTNGMEATVQYYPDSSGDSHTLNSIALGGRLFSDLYAVSGAEEYRTAAEKLLTFVSNKQTAAGGWMYRDPPSSSHLSMDNYHNGFIVESYQRYREVTGSDRFDRTISRGVEFYRDVLFDAEGAPNWDETSSYPKDVHAAAQGIVVFAKLGDFEFADRILEWTLENLHAGDGRFYYQRRRLYTKRFTLMRWCQAWMAYALSVYLRERHATGRDEATITPTGADGATTPGEDGRSDRTTDRSERRSHGGESE